MLENTSLQDNPVRQENSGPALSTLTINTQPAGARVRIMNIVEKYQPGMLLESDGEYDVLVDHPGYVSWRKSITLELDVHTESVILAKKDPVYPTFVRITGGQFNMGCSSGDKNCESFEKPSRSVTVSDFGMTNTEITVGQFRSFVDATGYRTDAERNSGGFKGCYIWSESSGITRSSAGWNWRESRSWKNPGYKQNNNYPVSCVSWNDAQQYASWLSQQSGKLYRLPTEAEWEFAARAGRQSRFPFEGDNSSTLCKYANVADRSKSPNNSDWDDQVACSDRHWFAAPVASYRPNTLGLYDLLGNLREWVEDSWSNSYRGAAADGSAFSDTKSKDKVLRGGAWDSPSKGQRVSVRSLGPKSSRAAMIGFRLVQQ